MSTQNPHTVKWGALPPSRRGRQLSPERRAQMDQLKARPGQWAVVQTASSWNANELSTTARTFKKYGFDAKLRTRSADQKTDLWASWPAPSEEDQK